MEPDLGIQDPMGWVGGWLEPPKGDVEKVIHMIYKLAGRPSAEDHKRYPMYHPMVAGTGRMGFQYVSEYKGTASGESWEVPQWTLVAALNINQLARDAESIGRELGYDSGLAVGKSFVKRLAAGTMDPSTFEDADSRDDRRLNRKRW